jgi:hypothetical protein
MEQASAYCQWNPFYQHLWQYWLIALMISVLTVLAQDMPAYASQEQASLKFSSHHMRKDTVPQDGRFGV